MKLHKTLQKVDLETLGMFVQRITSAGYELHEITELLDMPYFAEAYEKGLLGLKLGEVGQFIQRCCHIDRGAYTLDDVKDLLTKKFD